MQSEKSDLSENSSIGMRLAVDPRSDGIPVLDGRWRWEIISESNGKLYVRVEGEIGECKTLRFSAPLTADDAKRMNVWLLSKIPGMPGATGKG
jgi:hypothetical protein